MCDDRTNGGAQLLCNDAVHTVADGHVVDQPPEALRNGGRCREIDGRATALNVKRAEVLVVQIVEYHPQRVFLAVGAQRLGLGAGVAATGVDPVGGRDGYVNRVADLGRAVHLQRRVQRADAQRFVLHQLVMGGHHGADAHAAIRVDHGDVAQCRDAGRLAVNGVAVRNGIGRALLGIIEGQTDHTTFAVHIKERLGGAVVKLVAGERLGLCENDGAVFGRVGRVGVLPVALQHAARRHENGVGDQILTRRQKDHAAAQILDGVQRALNGSRAVRLARRVGGIGGIGRNDVRHHHVIRGVFGRHHDRTLADRHGISRSGGRLRIVRLVRLVRVVRDIRVVRRVRGLLAVVGNARLLCIAAGERCAAYQHKSKQQQHGFEPKRSFHC